MKENTKKLLILIAYLPPYVFLGMLGDVDSSHIFGNFGILGYILMIACPCILSVFAKKLSMGISTVLLGNCLSCVNSFIFLEIFKTEKWEWFFKPFTKTQFLITISIIIFVVQLIVYLCIKNTTNKNNK